MPQIHPIRSFLRVRRVQLCKQISYLEMTGHYSYQLTGSPFYGRQFLTIGILLLNSSTKFVVSTKLSLDQIPENPALRTQNSHFLHRLDCHPNSFHWITYLLMLCGNLFFICLNRKAFSMNPFQFEKRAQFRKELTEQCDAAADLIFKGLSSSLLSLCYLFLSFLLPFPLSSSLTAFCFFSTVCVPKLLNVWVNPNFPTNKIFNFSKPHLSIN